MGLFVGASVITVFEMVDALLHNLFKMQLNEDKPGQKGTPDKRPKEKKKKDRKVSINVSSCVHAPSQWETTLQCNVVSHWLGAFTKWSPCVYVYLLFIFLLCDSKILTT